MKELYTKPELELDEFKMVDVLTASGDIDGRDQGYDDGDDFE